MQTELSLLKCTQTIIFEGESNLCKETHEVGTEMSDFTQRMTDGSVEYSKKPGV